MDTSTALHNISFHDKYGKDWAIEHVIYIQQWANRVQFVRDAPILDGDITYLDAYMKWYLKVTRRFITREFAYWEILVRQQFNGSFMD